MKPLLLFLLISGSVFGQIKPRVAIEYNLYENYRIGDSDILNLPHLSVKFGLSYTWRFLTADFDNKFWVADGNGATFRPVQAKFDIGIEARRGLMKLRLSHTCWHPCLTLGIEPAGIYGGGTWIGLSYGY